MESSKISLIIVFTQSSNIERSKIMTKDIKFEDVIDIITKDIPGPNGIVIHAYGINKLIQLNLKRYKRALNMEMKKSYD